jgi:NADPH:quinone reductase-like Zn-dependent oxidoreductase
MKAVQYDAYGGVERLLLRDAPSPQAPDAGVRVRVASAALNPKDALFRKGKFRVASGRRFPKGVGVDFAGEVIESRSPRFAEGDRVFGMLEEWRYERGTLAEEVAPREREVAALPAGVSFEAGAATALVGLTALQALRDLLHVGSGSRVFIHGASGGVGTAAIQIARILGGVVTTTSSAQNTALCRDLGAERALDYREDDIYAAGGFDAVFDVFGNLDFARAKALLAPGATFVSAVPTPGRLAAEALGRLGMGRRRLVVVRARPPDLDQLGAWLLDERLRAVVDSRYGLDECREAFTRLESKRARGKIVIEVAG